MQSFWVRYSVGTDFDFELCHLAHLFFQRQFPVIHRQWESVQRFKPQIITKARHQFHLLITAPAPHQLAETVVAIMLLDGKAILDYLDELMDARHSLLRQNYNSVPPETLILHITQQLHILHDTLTQVYALFVDAGDGSEESQLESVQRKISPSNVESSNGSAHLQHFSSFEVGEKRHRLEAVSRHLHHFVKTFVEEERDRFRRMLADVKESVVLLELRSSVFTTLEFHQETWQQVVVEF